MINRLKRIVVTACGAVLLSLALSAVPAAAHEPAQAEPGEAVRLVQGGCGAAIASVERSTGGRVIQADMVVDGGQARCRIVVLIPSPDPNRPPRRQVVVVPAN